MSSVLDAFLMVVGSTVMFAAPVYLVLQPWIALRLKGGWRTAALVPLILAVPLLAWCAYAFTQESNLWPVPFLLFAPFGTAYLLGVFLIHRWSAPKAG